MVVARPRRAAALVALVLAMVLGACGDNTDRLAAGQCSTDAASMARAWDEAALDSIRRDFPAPTVHARNLFHLSAAMWDAWALLDASAGEPLFATAPAFDAVASGDLDEPTLAMARNDAIAGAAWRLLRHRYSNAIDRRTTLDALDATVAEQCGIADPAAHAADNPDTALALGVAIANAVIEATIDDGSLERLNYEHPDYRPVNPPLIIGSNDPAPLIDPDRWQPLILAEARSQNGLLLPAGAQRFIGSNWGSVEPWSVDWRSLDPAQPPSLAAGDPDGRYIDGVVDVVRWSARLGTSPNGPVMVDISPGSLGANPLGTNRGSGHPENPSTGAPYESQVVDEADYLRVIAEYWADGPTSETPPGHWNSLANEATDATAPDGLRIGGNGAAVDRLEWDVKQYLALNAALHDAAITAWGVKADHDSARPITMLRHLASSDLLPTVPGLIEPITQESARAGERHAHLEAHVGELAIWAWAGPPADPESARAGVDWIAVTDWLPYQRPTFVTPAFAGYVSGHSVFSRAAAETMARFTGTEWLPGGLLTHTVKAGALLHEDGPTTDVTLQWATWFDASDQAGLSRLPGGIHVPADDVDGRRVGAAVAEAAWERTGQVLGLDP